MSSWRDRPQSRTANAAATEFVFELEWKIPTKSTNDREDVGAKIGAWKPDPTVDLRSFKSYLCQDLGLSGDVALSWVDSDGDELPIGSECEFREAVKSQTKKKKTVKLTIDKVEKLGGFDRRNLKQSLTGGFARGELFIKEKSSAVDPSDMAPVVMNDLVEGNRRPVEISKNGSTSSAPSAEAVPPVWFKSYMETMKNDIVKEVSAKVMADVLGVLNKGQSEASRPCSQSATPRSRNLRETNNEEKQQHRKKKKRVVEEVESSDTFSPPQQMDVALLRKVKKIEKRERHLQRKLDHKLERLEHMTRIIVETKNRCHAVTAIAKNLDKNCKLNENTAEPLAASATPQDTTMQYASMSTVSNGASSSESRPRMNCSVTGHEMLDKTTGKEIAYESDSDSDNISIISGISNVSDLDHDYNFEMIQTPPCFILDKPLNNRESQTPKVQEKLDNSTPNSPEKQNVYNVVCEGESDRNNNRDSPSYEVLSGPASSASSIHLDEDHFHMSHDLSEHITNADLIDLNHDDPETRKGSAFVVDIQGKIFEKNVVQERKESSEIHLDKRPGGVYAFVNETLPIHTTKDASEMSKSETNAEEFNGDNCNLNLNMKDSHLSYGTEEKKGADKAEAQTTQSQSNLESQGETASASNQESSHSFSSHTSHATGNSNVYNFTQVQTRTNYSAPKYTVVDNNVSKGLGTEMKYNSLENNLGARGCQAKREERSSDATSRVKYQRGFTSEGAGCVFTEQPQKSSPEDGTRESSPDFGRATIDSVHILPETLVSGAVTLASSAYTTARKAFDRIRNIQTGEGHEHVQNGVTIGSDIEAYFTVLQEMGFTNVDLNARLLDQFNYDMSRVISELVQ